MKRFRLGLALIFLAHVSVGAYAEPVLLTAPCFNNTSLTCATGIDGLEYNGITYNLRFFEGSIDSVYGEDFTPDTSVLAVYPDFLWSPVPWDDILLAIISSDIYGILAAGDPVSCGSSFAGFPTNYNLGDGWYAAELWGDNCPWSDSDFMGPMIDVDPTYDFRNDYPWRYVSWAVFSLALDIDIKPGSDPNSINLKSKGVIPVAILTTDSFDASQVDWETVSFGPDGASKSHAMGHIKDVDEDGDLDLLLHFNTQETGITCGDTEATLTGETFSGESITGSDSVVTVNCD
jgi:hypothetical protein